MKQCRERDPPWVDQEKVLVWSRIYGKQKEKTFLESLAAKGTS